MAVRKSTLSTLSVLTAGGTLLLGVTLLTSSRSQSIEKPDTPLKVALVLDCITQPRFQEDMKNFGMSRMLPTAGGHLMVGRLMLSTQKDRDLFKTAESSHRAFAIGFFHCAHIPGKFVPAPSAPGQFEGHEERPMRSLAKAKSGRLVPAPAFAEPEESVTPVCNSLLALYHIDRKTASEEEQKLYREMGEAAQKGLPKLRKGQGITQDAGDWLVVAQPVRAMKTSCLKCHQGAKQGDTLGVLTYVVSKKTFAEASVTGSKPGALTRGGF